MMMGPETVAECLTSKGISFDMVIFDEASQLPSYKALIPISKGEKCLFQSCFDLLFCVYVASADAGDGVGVFFELLFNLRNFALVHVCCLLI